MTVETSPAAFAMFSDPSDLKFIETLLPNIREKFDMDVAYLSEFGADKAVIRAVSAPGLENMIQTGQAFDLNEIYCRHIIDGGLPRLMTDTSAHQIARDLPITQLIPIRSHLSVPVYRTDASVYGMLCCIGRDTRPMLTERDVRLMEALSSAIGTQMR
ncbi:GAF domain-containing protein [Limimaricola pyoseonensis]|uniref:GAF domain-containing protein n=1 Tax=Limimaricola pyoseonensis TaxID=521013 RepID=A0A1G7CVC9_9RHOB|nr:GAF domain-containing protein [Limimaricola pyoseonensis]SDE42586.1 GAF domain-containing protein [Limimaricola pyoseonensis]